ncbi:P1 family peptidase [Parahaliea mediterranea]|uniref:P1 family peptidase n=1 Tax=Parahaliea mediterranea TaxID=651086 RepID=UPI001F4D66D7|nr:P1 family peptidase [Parahaliea mediterranea]
MLLNAGERTLTFDWPMIRVGTGEYPEGPTGVTVFHFAEKVLGAVDVRGGAPGTVNTEYLKLGYDLPEVDAVVFAGGSWYGLEAATAVASAMKEDGLRDGNAFSAEPNIALSVGSIIYDFGARRLNEIVPDKPLAQAAFRNARPGWFPQGAQGAGRMAMSGYFFGCNAMSGQGGAFREINGIKVAAFTVVNAIGVITDRDGNVLACNRDPEWPADMDTSALLARANGPLGIGSAVADPAGNGASKNTTVSLVVTNQKLSPAELNRLAVQVHTSMGRGLQPFATQFDGDVLYAVSTAEVEEKLLSSAEIGALASEVMWDAIIASVPEQPQHPTPQPELKVGRALLDQYAGVYEFSPGVSLQVVHKDGVLRATATGRRDVFAIARDREVQLVPVSSTDFTVANRYPLTLRFQEDGSLLVNPGHWQQLSRRKIPM